MEFILTGIALGLACGLVAYAITKLMDKLK